MKSYLFPFMSFVVFIVVLIKFIFIIITRRFFYMKTKSDLHKILDNFYHKCFLIEEMTSYDNLYVQPKGKNSSIISSTAILKLF